MSSKLLILLPMLLFLTAPGRAQTNTQFERGIVAGYTYAKSHFLQLGVLHGKHYGDAGAAAYGYGAGIELGTVDHEVALGLKGFTEYNPFNVLAIRVNAITYFREDRLDLRLVPEVGFTAMGKATLLYGYGKHVAGKELQGIQEHRVSLAFTFFPGE